MNNMQQMTEKASPMLGETKFIGQILLDTEKITAPDAERVLNYQRQNEMRFGEAALKLKLISEDDLQFALSRQFSYSYLRANLGEFESELIAAYDPFAEQVEELRAIRSHLVLRWFNEQNRALAIVSADRGEGRSYLAANLAVVFSQLGERTLLIDADFRSSYQHSIFKTSNDHGLSIWLSGRGESLEITSVPHFSNLKVLSAGPKPPNPQELLCGARFNNLLTELQQSFDVILIDTPPCERYTDAEIISSRVGGALLVSHKNKTRLNSAKTTVDKIQNAGAAVVGSVLNSF